MTKYLGPKTDPANVSTQGDKPDLATTAPSQITVTTAAQGSGTTAARADHVHSISTGTPTTQTGLGNDAGTSTALARADHQHVISPPRGKGSRSSNQSIGNNTTTVVQLTSADIQVNGVTVTNLSSSNARVVNGFFTGDYLIIGRVQWAGNNSGQRQIGYRLNGSTDTFSTASHVSINAAFRQSFSELVSLSASDYVQLIGFQTSGAALNIAEASISVVRVG